MEHLQELIELARQLDAVMDDNKEVYGLDISASGGVKFFTDPKYIIKTFSSFDVKETFKDDYPFRLSTEVEGVVFVSRTHLDEVHLLRGFIPDEIVDKYSTTEKPKKVFKIRTERQNDASLSTNEKAQSHWHANEQDVNHL
ncbi:hypothetical protein [Sporosarcina sp. FSL W7-1283]|uniref:hypothetical protein n=1 Tax=Sporosarcina sp. FSL W7-1283 TaxID=2921560 RepID=UPI0030F55936